jgi:hypothetical protein
MQVKQPALLHRLGRFGRLWGLELVMVLAGRFHFWCLMPGKMPAAQMVAARVSTAVSSVAMIAADCRRQKQRAGPKGNQRGNEQQKRSHGSRLRSIER